MPSDSFVAVESLRKYFRLGRGQMLHAVDDISFTIARGRTLGMAGESGCGKTTVGRTLIRLYAADGGRVLFDGQDVHKASHAAAHALSRRMQMIFQDPYASLDPRKTVGAIVGEGLVIHNLCPTRAARQARVYELLQMVGLSREHASRFPHEFSGGQRQRVGIARALAVNPEFIICDEAISALDVSIQAQIMNLLVRLQAQLGLTYLFISHDLSMMRHIADDIAVMYLGVLVEKAPTAALFAAPLHPYTRGLLAAVPEPDPDFEQRRPQTLLAGEVPSPLNPGSGCRFRARCEKATELCAASTPPLTDHGAGHFVACHHIRPSKSLTLFDG
ncbi:ABC transporter ATP-binding protein [Clostridia bacterium]|nr:ABC transporter ATP-binding protein [Clostridia bacterium]